MYRNSAPIMEFLCISSPLCEWKYICLTICVPYTVRPANTGTPISEIIHCMPLEPRNTLSRLAMIMPQMAMVKNVPMPERSRLVV